MLLVLLALVFFTFGGSATGTSSVQAPSLRLVSTSPLVVRGRYFEPGATVRVVATAGKVSRSRTARISPAGAFRLSFGTIRSDRCSAGLVVTATGRHDRAVLKLPSPECPPA
jgi:hypothetical protein